MSEKALLAEILASRAEPEAQLKAMELLSEMQRQGTISKQGVVALARLLGRAGDWERGRQLMLDTLAKYGDDEQVSTTFVDLLIENGELSMANNRLDKLREINSKNPSIVPLTIKLAAKSGDRPNFSDTCRICFPRICRVPSNQQQLNSIATVARMTAENEQVEIAAEAVSRLCPAHGYRWGCSGICSFLTKHGDASQAMEILKQIFPKQMDKAISIATRCCESGVSRLAINSMPTIDEMLAAALRDDPDSASRLILRAETLEVQGKHDESIAFYEKILKRDDLPRIVEGRGQEQSWAFSCVDQPTSRGGSRADQ